MCRHHIAHASHVVSCYNVQGWEGESLWNLGSWIDAKSEISQNCPLFYLSIQ